MKRHLHLATVFTSFACLFPMVAFADGDIVTWTIASGGNGHSYERIDIPIIDWTDAETLAASLTLDGSPGYLATITSSAENDFIYNNLGGVDLAGHWIGGYQDRSAPDYNPADPTTGWRWITGEPWSYTNWVSGEPNNLGGNEDELQISWNLTSIGEAGWNDTHTVFPGEYLGYVVEFSTVPEPSALVLLLVGTFGVLLVRYWRSRTKVLRKKPIQWTAVIGDNRSLT